MKNKIKVVLIMLLASTVLLGGTSVAYYNTKKFGFDENAKVISRDNEKFSFMDFDFYYEDINQYVEKFNEFTPATPYSVVLS